MRPASLSGRPPRRAFGGLKIRRWQHRESSNLSFGTNINKGLANMQASSSAPPAAVGPQRDPARRRRGPNRPRDPRSILVTLDEAAAILGGGLQVSTLKSLARRKMILIVHAPVAAPSAGDGSRVIKPRRKPRLRRDSLEALADWPGGYVAYLMDQRQRQPTRAAAIDEVLANIDYTPALMQTPGAPASLLMARVQRPVLARGRHLGTVADLLHPLDALAGWTARGYRSPTGRLWPWSHGGVLESLPVVDVLALRAEAAARAQVIRHAALATESWRRK